MPPLKNRNLMLTDASAGRDNFDTYYLQANSSWGGPAEITLSLSSFVSTVQSHISTTVPASDMVLKFIHRYDTTTNEWFLTMECCALGSFIETTPDGEDVHAISSISGARYDLKNDSITSSTFTGSQDANYFDLNVVDAQGISRQLVTNSDVESVQFHWDKEVAQCLSDNSTSTPISIKLSSVAFEDASGNFPHSIMVSLIGSGGELLDDTPYTNPYQHKAADLATLCPPNCLKVVIPA